jgi:hypothetical protein
LGTGGGGGDDSATGGKNGRNSPPAKVSHAPSIAGFVNFCNAVDGGAVDCGTVVSGALDIFSVFGYTVTMKSTTFAGLKTAVAAAVLCAAAPVLVSAADGPDITFDFQTSALTYGHYSIGSAYTAQGTVAPDDTLDSFAGNDLGDTEFTYTYDGTDFGGTFTVGIADGYGTDYLSYYGLQLFEVDELFAWVAPAANAKVTVGIFKNHEGINFYDDTIDDYEPGIPLGGVSAFADVDVNFTDGVLVDYAFPGFTAQVLLGPNISPGTQGLASGDPRDATYGFRIFAPLGDRIIATALYKTRQAPYPGTDIAYGEHIFAVFATVAANDALEFTVGYTGFVPILDYPNANDRFFNAVDLRGIFKPTSTVTITSHNNLSIADNSALQASSPKTRLFFLYNALAAEFDLGGDVSVTPKVSNIFLRQEVKKSGGTQIDRLLAGVDLKKRFGDSATIKCGLELALQFQDRLNTKAAIDDSYNITYTQFSIPVGVTVKW